jgi:molybdenum cofactor guanylyltransferase
MPTFSAVLLVGGKSTRMGQDKALLRMTDYLLWQWQLRTLEELQPAEIFWSGPGRPGLPGHVRVIADVVENAGPLAGISACLTLLQSDLLVALAIDLPRMNALFLKSLLKRCTQSCGVVARRDDFFEPLAAVYPKDLQIIADEHLSRGRYSLQDLIREAVQRGLLQAVALNEGDVPLFKNLNSPATLQDI